MIFSIRKKKKKWPKIQGQKNVYLPQVPYMPRELQEEVQWIIRNSKYFLGEVNETAKHTLLLHYLIITYS